MFGKKQTESSSVISSEPITANTSLLDEKKIIPGENSRRCTVIAKQSTFNGNIVVEGDIQVYGEVIGNIYVKEGTIRVMHAGKVEGELVAPEIIIDGSVIGTCSAQTIDILEHGELRGISRCVDFSVKRGGVFIGQSEEVERKEQLPSRVVSINKVPSESAVSVETKDDKKLKNDKPSNTTTAKVN